MLKTPITHASLLSLMFIYEKTAGDIIFSWN